MSRDFAADDDLVFRALGDSARRRILDILKAKPGITMGEICSHFSMTRFGVRKHLLLLEEAGLVSHQWERPSKKFYLNAVPIQLIYERWIADFSRFWSGRLIDLKADLEQNNNNSKEENNE